MCLNTLATESVQRLQANDTVMEAFEYHASPAHVVFGSGSINKLPDELSRLGLSKPLFLSTAQQLQQVEQLELILKNRHIEYAGTYGNATMCETRVSTKPQRSID